MRWSGKSMETDHSLNHLNHHIILICAQPFFLTKSLLSMRTIVIYQGALFLPVLFAWYIAFLVSGDQVGCFSPFYTLYHIEPTEYLPDIQNIIIVNHMKIIDLLDDSPNLMVNQNLTDLWLLHTNFRYFFIEIKPTENLPDKKVLKNSTGQTAMGSCKFVFCENAMTVSLHVYIQTT